MKTPIMAQYDKVLRTQGLGSMPDKPQEHMDYKREIEITLFKYRDGLFNNKEAVDILISVVKQEKQDERTQLLEQVREVVEGMKEPTHNGKCLPTFKCLGTLYKYEGYNQALSDLLSELSKLKGMYD